MAGCYGARGRGIVAGMFERFAGTDLLLAVALATFAIPALFLLVVGAAAMRRSGDRPIGSGLAALVALTGGASLGTLLLFGSDPLLAAPIVIVGGLLVAGRWRARRRAQAGWLAAGIGTPIVVAWALALAMPPPPALPSIDSVVGYAWLAGGLVVAGSGLLVALRGDLAPPIPSPVAPAGQPGSHAVGSIAAAIREPALIGPFGQPDLAMLVVFVVAWLAVPFLLPADTPSVVTILVPALVAAVAGTEAYVRSWPSRSRRAFEAFSWLGERELAAFSALNGGRPPSSSDAAQAWLATHPEDPAVPEAVGGRIEVLVLAGRLDEARAALARMPRDTAAQRFDQAAVADLVEWRAGATGTEADAGIEAMRRAAEAIEPIDGDERLAAEVAIATALVRRRMADGRSTAGDAIDPLVDVRGRLGRRADGQLGRALRRRLIPPLLVAALVITVLGQLLTGIGVPGL
jgi:hypothetical protein